MEFCKHIKFISMLNSARDAGAWGRGKDSTPPALDEQEQGGQSARMLSTDGIFLTFSSCIRSFFCKARPTPIPRIHHLPRNVPIVGSM